MQVVEAATAPGREDGGSLREGIQDAKVVLRGVEGTQDNRRVTLTRAVTNYSAPRHHHNFDQVRYIISGKFEYAKDKILPEGWVGYFPEGAYYGPQIRHQGLLLLLCQFGGADGNGYLSKAQHKSAVEKLNEKGKFEKGYYTFIDENGVSHNRDAFEVVWEAAMGRKLVYPEPRYDNIIVMNPDNFKWVQSSETPGVAYKWLGTFTERGTRTGFIRLDKGSTLRAGLHDSPEMLFLAKGKVSSEGHIYSLHSTFNFEKSEEPTTIRAEEPSEFFCLQFPKF